MVSHMNHIHNIVFTNQLVLLLSWFIKKTRILLPISSKFSGSRNKNLFENEDSAIGYEASWTGVFRDSK
jgi:hypothetical protein